MKFLPVFAAVAAALFLPVVRGAVVECVNVTDLALRFTVAGAAQSVDNLVPPKSVRRWSVPDELCPLSYQVESVNGSTVVSLASLAVDVEKYYVATFDGAAGFTASDRTYDAAVVQDIDELLAARRVGYVKYGMLVQFGVEVAGIIWWLLRWGGRAGNGSSQSID